MREKGEEEEEEAEGAVRCGGFHRRRRGCPPGVSSLEAREGGAGHSSTELLRNLL